MQEEDKIKYEKLCDTILIETLELLKLKIRRALTDEKDGDKMIEDLKEKIKKDENINAKEINDLSAVLKNTTALKISELVSLASTINEKLRGEEEGKQLKLEDFL